MLNLKTSITEKVTLDNNLTFEIRAMTREEFIAYHNKVRKLTAGKTEDEIGDELYDITMEVVENCVVASDEKTREVILEKIRNAPIAVQNKLFERIMELSTVGK